jgi:subtilisin family serine protease/subtilisin-like proprotein convertase family protein
LAVADSANSALPEMLSHDHRAGSLIVQFRDGSDAPGSLAAHVLTANLEPAWSIAPGMRKVDLTSTADLATALAAFQQDPHVQFVEPDYHVSLEQTPNDPNFDSLWGLDNHGQTGGTDDADIDAPEAWDKFTGSSSTIVAVIDTGVDYTHPDLAANIWTNPGEIPGNGKDDDHNGYVDDVHGYDFVNHDGDPMDDHFHGTHVAGTIGAVGDNGIGIAGVNWHVQIMACKFLDETGSGYESDAIAALNYAVANGAAISNNSWGGLGFSAAFQTALQNAAAKGHIFVAAAGNNGWNNDRDAFYPASYDVPNVVSVAATDNNDQLAWFSNYGAKSVDLAAPGVNIYSTFPTHETQAMQDEGFNPYYGTISGTSMATPHVTGVLALVHSLHPEFDYQKVIERVLDSVDVIDGAAQTITGGRVNAASAVGNAPPDTTGPRVVGTDPTSAVGAVDHVRLRFNEGIDPSTISLADVISLKGPDGDITPTSVSPVPGNNRQFDVKFAAQTAIGTYTLVLGANIKDLAGNLLDQDRDGTGGELTDDWYTATFDISDQLTFDSPDVPKHIDVLDFLFGQPVESILTIGSNINISDLNLKLNIYYPNDEELKIYLRSPSGTEVTLVDQAEAYGEGFYDTVFDDEAPTSFGSGDAPYAGSYRPTSPLSAFNGENAAGNWTLVIEAYLGDFLAGEGDLFSWSLDIAGGGTPPPPPPPPPPPGNRAPIAGDDALQGGVNTRLAVAPAQLLSNDVDSDGDLLSITFVGNPSGGSVAIDSNQLITFTPDPDFQGQASFQYIVSDGFLIDTGNVTIDFEPVFQWHNTSNAADVDKDSVVSANDVLTIINFINAHGSGTVIGLSSGVQPKSYLDVTADNCIAADDVVTVINFINAHPDQPLTKTTSVSSAPNSTEIDVALMSLLTDGDNKRN